jgi:mercuric ion transport protein
MKTDPETPINTPSWLGIGAVLAAIGASACCVGPFLLLSLGIGGAWMSTLTAMESIRPFFIILTLFFIALGYRKLYLMPYRCEDGQTSATAPCVTLPPASMQSCAVSNIQRRQRMMFWLGSLFILILLAFPWLAPFFID